MTRKQRGGTLLGLVMGGLIGLGIALAVAVYITKVPVPLMNKIPQHNFDSDAAEVRKNKDWNPNAPLAGKNFARSGPAASGEIAPMEASLPALPASASGRVAQPGTGPAPAAPAATAAPSKAAKIRPAEPLDDTQSASIPAVAASAKPAKSTAVALPAVAATAALASTAPARSGATDPIGDLARTRTTDPIGELARSRSADLASVAATSDPFNYFIQAGAFRTPEEAEKQRNRLQTLGMDSRVTEREQAGRMVYRVRIGPFDKKDDADKMKARMESHSIDTALVRVQR